MGWASGSKLFSKIIECASRRIDDDVSRQEFYQDIIPVFEDKDWDTQDECMGIDHAYDAALVKLHPGWFDDD